MTRSTTLGLAVAFAAGLAVPALAQTASTQTTPAAAAPAAPADSGLKATAPETKPAAPARHRHGHAKHAVKTAPAVSH